MSQQLNREDWLAAAQRLAVGRKDRIMHRGDGSRRQNLVIANEGDKYWAYCQACKVGDVVTKDHVRLSEVAPRESTRLDPPEDAVEWDALPPHRRIALESFLLRKGVGYHMLRRVCWSESRKRLLVYPHTWRVGESLGRDVTGRSLVKWIVYGRARDQWVLEPVAAQPAGGSALVLTEDLFSMYKVQWALERAGLGAWVGTTLGTGIKASMLRDIIQGKFSRVVVFYDGDPAGARGSSQVSRRIRALLPGVPVVGMTAPAGMDPKDMQFNPLIRQLDTAGVVHD